MCNPLIPPTNALIVLRKLNQSLKMKPSRVSKLILHDSNTKSDTVSSDMIICLLLCLLDILYVGLVVSKFPSLGTRYGASNSLSITKNANILIENNSK